MGQLFAFQPNVVRVSALGVVLLDLLLRDLEAAEAYELEQARTEAVSGGQIEQLPRHTAMRLQNEAKVRKALIGEEAHEAGGR